MNRRRVHILYEHGLDLRPYGSAYIRLLRPLMHPSLRDDLEVTAGLKYEGQGVDAVIVDRLWRPDISRALAKSLVENIHRAGAKLIYALDDNLPDLPARRWPLVSWSATESLWVMRFFLRQADSVWVTTPALQARLAEFNPRITVVPNALDERLLVGRRPSPAESPFGWRRKVIGYMGTLTHDDDLMMVLPAMQTVWEHHRDEIEFQLVGVVGHTDTLQALRGLPVRVVGPNPEEMEYPLFMLWFSSRLCWDIAISPLQDTPFNRCKSDIKFLDYSAIGAAGIYSRVSAYESRVRHLETGWLVENSNEAWVDALETLLAQDSVRLRLARNAAQYLYAERILARCARNWLEALTHLLSEPEGNCWHCRQFNHKLSDKGAGSS